MNNFLSQKWCLCLNVRNRKKLCCAKNHKFGDETTVCLPNIYLLPAVHPVILYNNKYGKLVYELEVIIMIIIK